MSRSQMTARDWPHHQICYISSNGSCLKQSHWTTASYIILAYIIDRLRRGYFSRWNILPSPHPDRSPPVDDPFSRRSPSYPVLLLIQKRVHHWASHLPDHNTRPSAVQMRRFIVGITEPTERPLQRNVSALGMRTHPVTARVIPVTDSSHLLVSDCQENT